MVVKAGTPLQNELGALLSGHSPTDIAHATPYVLLQLGVVAECPAPLESLLLKVAIIAGVDPKGTAESQKSAIDAFYKKYPPHQELVKELLRILRDPTLKGADALKALGSQVATFDPQPRDKNKQVGGGAMGMFNAAQLFDKNQDKS